MKLVVHQFAQPQFVLHVLGNLFGVRVRLRHSFQEFLYLLVDAKHVENSRVHRFYYKTTFLLCQVTMESLFVDLFTRLRLLPPFLNARDLYAVSQCSHALQFVVYQLSNVSCRVLAPSVRDKYTPSRLAARMNQARFLDNLPLLQNLRCVRYDIWHPTHHELVCDFVFTPLQLKTLESLRIISHVVHKASVTEHNMWATGFDKLQERRLALKQLQIRAIDIGSLAITSITGCLQKGVFSELRRLSVMSQHYSYKWSTDTTVSFVHAAQHCPKLRELNFSTCNYWRTGPSCFLDTVSVLSNLQVLNVSHNNFHPEDYTLEELRKLCEERRITLLL